LSDPGLLQEPQQIRIIGSEWSYMHPLDRYIFAGDDISAGIDGPRASCADCAENVVFVLQARSERPKNALSLNGNAVMWRLWSAKTAVISPAPPEPRTWIAITFASYFGGMAFRQRMNELPYYRSIQKNPGAPETAAKFPRLFISAGWDATTPDACAGTQEEMSRRAVGTIVPASFVLTVAQ
jgi:hypothetical protein